MDHRCTSYFQRNSAHGLSWLIFTRSALSVAMRVPIIWRECPAPPKLACACHLLPAWPRLRSSSTDSRTPSRTGKAIYPLNLHHAETWYQHPCQFMSTRKEMKATRKFDEKSACFLFLYFFLVVVREVVDRLSFSSLHLA